jgi:hypothetical protein
MRTNELDALIESTMAFARLVNRQAKPQVAASVRTAEQSLGPAPESPKPRSPMPTIVWSVSERDQIQKRVNDFRAHQEKIKREREDYYSQVKARMMASTTFLAQNKDPSA